MTDLSLPRIICAAVRRPDGCIVAGPRHFDQTMWCQILGITPAAFRRIQAEPHTDQVLTKVKAWQGAEEGFIDQHGAFYTREEAWKIAYEMGQIDAQELLWQPGNLHSEHLY